MKLLSAMSSLVVLGGCLDAPPETSGPTEVGTLDGAALDKASDVSAAPDVGDAAPAPDLPDVVRDAGDDVATDLDALNDAAMDAGGLPCGDEWKVEWRSNTIDISAAIDTPSIVPVVASPTLVYLAGGDGAGAARIFRSENGQPMVSVFDDASARFHDARCRDGACWFGGGGGKFGAMSPEGLQVFSTGPAPDDFVAHSVGAMAGLGAAFTPDGIILSPAPDGDSVEYLAHDGLVASRATCNSEECFAVAVDSAVPAVLLTVRLDAVTRETSGLAAAGLPFCTSPSCNVGAVAASERMWLIAIETGGLYRSFDDGVTWGVFSNSLNGPHAQWKLEFRGATGFVAPDDKLYVTVNDGVQWKGVTAPSPVRGISLLDRFSGVVVDDSAVRWFDIVCPP